MDLPSQSVQPGPAPDLECGRLAETRIRNTDGGVTKER